MMTNVLLRAFIFFSLAGLAIQVSAKSLLIEDDGYVSKNAVYA
jgi:hypothetical protein